MWLRILIILLFTPTVTLLTACQGRAFSGDSAVPTVDPNVSTQQVLEAYPANPTAQIANRAYPVPLTTVSDSSYTPPVTDSSSIPPKVQPTQDPTLGILTGQAYSKVLNQPLKETITRLAKVYREGDQGVYVLDEAFSPLAWTNGEGYFTFYNVEPGEYVLVFGDVYDKYEIVQESSGLPITYQVEAGETLDLIRIEVDLP